MSTWQCGIDGCDRQFDHVEAAIVHQTVDHERRECKVCGGIVPDGYFAIRHAFDEHTRAEYVRAYGANSEEVRQRETIKKDIEQVANMQEVVRQLDEAGARI